MTIFVRQWCPDLSIYMSMCLIYVNSNLPSLLLLSTFSGLPLPNIRYKINNEASNYSTQFHSEEFPEILSICSADSPTPQNAWVQISYLDPIKSPRFPKSFRTLETSVSVLYCSNWNEAWRYTSDVKIKTFSQFLRKKKDVRWRCAYSI